MTYRITESFPRFDRSTDAILGEITRVRDDVGPFVTKGWALHVADKLAAEWGDSELSFHVVDEAGVRVYAELPQRPVVEVFGLSDEIPF